MCAKDENTGLIHVSTDINLGVLDRTDIGVVQFLAVRSELTEGGDERDDGITH
jgi:hypothetical protein